MATPLTPAADSMAIKSPSLSQSLIIDGLSESFLQHLEPQDMAFSTSYCDPQLQQEFNPRYRNSGALPSWPMDDFEPETMMMAHSNYELEGSPAVPNSLVPPPTTFAGLGDLMSNSSTIPRSCPVFFNSVPQDHEGFRGNSIPHDPLHGPFEYNATLPTVDEGLYVQASHPFINPEHLVDAKPPAEYAESFGAQSLPQSPSHPSDFIITTEPRQPEPNIPQEKEKDVYAQLLHQCLSKAPENRLTLKEIYDWFEKETGKAKSESKGWQNSVRHNLSMNEAFKKVEPEGRKGHMWCLTPEALEGGVQPTTRYRNKQPSKRKLAPHYSGGRSTKKPTQTRRPSLRRSARINAEYPNEYIASPYAIPTMMPMNRRHDVSRGSSVTPMNTPDEFQVYQARPYSPAAGNMYSVIGSPAPDFIQTPNHGSVNGDGDGHIASRGMSPYPLMQNDGIIFYDSDTTPSTPLSATHVPTPTAIPPMQPENGYEFPNAGQFRGHPASGRL